VPRVEKCVYDDQAVVRGVHGVVNVSDWMEGSVEN